MEHRQLVVVAGGAGYVGSVLVPRLLDEGHRVRVIDSLVFGRRGLEPVLDRIELIEEDVRTVSGSVLRDADALINLAALSNDPTADFRPELCWDVNAEGAVRLGELCVEQAVGRYLFASSCSVYDTRDPAQVPEACSEEAPVRPVGPYSSSKHEAELRLRALASDRFAPVVLRKGTLYGFSPRMRFDLVVNTFVRFALDRGGVTLHDGGRMHRPLLGVDDAANAYVRLLDAPASAVSGQIFNLVHRNMSVSDVAEDLQRVCRSRGISVELRSAPSPGPVRNYRATAEKATRLLGIRSTTTVGEAVDDMLTRLPEAGYVDFDNPWYSNIAWMEQQAV